MDNDFICKVVYSVMSRNTPISLVFLIIDKFMKRRNPNYIFYLTSALFYIKSEQIEALLNEVELLLPYLNKKIKDFKSEEDINLLFLVAD